MTPEGQRRAGRAFRAAVLAVPLALSGFWLWTRPERASSRYDDALDRALLPVMQQSEVQHKLGAATFTQARLLARELAPRSVQYVDARDLELWAKARLEVARSSKPACARLWTGGDPSHWGPALAALGAEPLEAYVDMLARALARRLERKPVPPLPEATIDRGLSAIAEQLPQGARERFEADVKRRPLSDERACELFFIVASGAEKLDPATRADFYRALAAAPELMFLFSSAP